LVFLVWVSILVELDGFSGASSASDVSPWPEQGGLWERQLLSHLLLLSSCPGYAFRYSTHCEQSGRFGLHHQFLERLDCPFVATLTSSIDSLLDAVDMLL
jgi:hypothetical protein